MSRKQVVTTLRRFIREFAIDPHDAGLVLERIPADGIDAETFGDYLDGAGYPELAESIYAEAN